MVLEEFQSVDVQQMVGKEGEKETSTFLRNEGDIPMIGDVERQ